MPLTVKPVNQLSAIQNDHEVIIQLYTFLISSELKLWMQTFKVRFFNSNPQTSTNPMKKTHIILTILAICISMGYFYCLDIPQTLQSTLREHPHFLTVSQFNLLYFSTYLAQFLFLFPLGILVDNLPLSLTMPIIIAVSIVTEATIGVALNARFKGYPGLMYFCRGLSGICGLGIMIIQGKLVNKFAHKHYEYIMGLCLNIPNLFTALNSVLTSVVVKETDSIPLCFYIGSFTCVISLIVAIVIIQVYLKPDEERREQQQRQLIQEAAPRCSFELLREFPFQFWLLILSIILTLASMLPMADNLLDFIVKSFGIAHHTAGALIMILYLGGVPFAFYLGHFVEAYPEHKRNMMVWSKAAYLVLLIIVAVLPRTDSPSALHFIVIVLFLLVFSFNLTMFHSIVEPITSYYIKPEHVGTSWGIIGSSLGLCQCVFSLINMGVLSSSASALKAYSKLTILFVVMAVLSLAIALWIRFRDTYEKLDRPFVENENDHSSDLEEIPQKQ